MTGHHQGSRGRSRLLSSVAIASLVLPFSTTAAVAQPAANDLAPAEPPRAIDLIAVFQESRAFWERVLPPEPSPAPRLVRTGPAGGFSRVVVVNAEELATAAESDASAESETPTTLRSFSSAIWTVLSRRP